MIHEDTSGKVTGLSSERNKSSHCGTVTPWTFGRWNIHSGNLSLHGTFRFENCTHSMLTGKQAKACARGVMLNIPGKGLTEIGAVVYLRPLLT